MWFSLGSEDIGKELRKINQWMETVMATFTEVVQAWKDAYNGQKSRADAAEAALGDAQAQAQANADALAQFQADDAATDAQQIADATQALADQLQAALDEVQGTNVPEPPAEEPVDPGTGGEVPPDAPPPVVDVPGEPAGGGDVPAEPGGGDVPADTPPEEQPPVV